MKKMTTKERVENILKASALARNSDTELLLIYMQKSGMELSEKQKQVFRDMTAPESITRARRQLQEQGKYEASEVVQEARYEKMKEHQTEYGIGDSADPHAYLHKLGYKIVED
jgi:hypothetical protein